MLVHELLAGIRIQVDDEDVHRRLVATVLATAATPAGCEWVLDAADDFADWIGDAPSDVERDVRTVLLAAVCAAARGRTERSGLGDLLSHTKQLAIWVTKHR